MYPAGGVAPFRAPVKGAGEVVLGGGRLVIPEGAIIHMPIAAIQMLPGLWQHPEKFDPSRWLQVRAPLTICQSCSCVSVAPVGASCTGDWFVPTRLWSRSSKVHMFWMCTSVISAQMNTAVVHPEFTSDLASLVWIFKAIISPKHDKVQNLN